MVDTFDARLRVHRNDRPIRDPVPSSPDPDDDAMSPRRAIRTPVSPKAKGKGDKACAGHHCARRLRTGGRRTTRFGDTI
jgi:hypothetical protein